MVARSLTVVPAKAEDRQGDRHRREDKSQLPTAKRLHQAKTLALIISQLEVLALEYVDREQ